MKKIGLFLLSLLCVNVAVLVRPVVGDGGTIVDHYDLSGVNGRIDCSVYIYQDATTMSTEDFYALKVNVHARDELAGAYFNWAGLRVTAYYGAICDMWQPLDGVQGEGIVSVQIGAIAFSIWIPTSYVWFGGAYTGDICWSSSSLMTKDASFAPCFYINKGVRFDFLFQLTVTRTAPWVSWTDTVEFSPSPNSLYVWDSVIGGKTSLLSGTYAYNYGVVVIVYAIPCIDWEFNCWVFDGAIVYQNPIVVVTNVDHSLKAYFSFPSGGGGCHAFFC